MKITVNRPLELDVSHVSINVPVRYGTEDIPADFPGRVTNKHGEDEWHACINIETGIVCNWPQGRTADVHMKVCDEGSYSLLCGDRIVCSMIDEYVPTAFPGDHFGDYIIFDIDGDGAIKRWNGRKIADCIAERSEDSE